MKHLLPRKILIAVVTAVLLVGVGTAWYLLDRGERTDKALVTIGSKTIAPEDFQGELALLRRSGELPKAVLTISPAGKRKVLEQMIRRLLFVEAARQEGIELDADVRRLLQRFEEDKRAEAYIEAELTEDPITEQEMRNYYQQHKKEFTTLERRHLHHIVVKDEALAHRLREQVERGVSMATLAREYNIDATKQRGGDLGWVRPGVMVPAFEDAAFSLDVGEISPVVATSFGYHIIRAEDKQEAESMSYAEAEAEIHTSLVAQRVERLESGLREQHPIQVNETLWQELLTADTPPDT